MHIDEFQKSVFRRMAFSEGSTEEHIDRTVNDLIEEVIEPNKLAFDGAVTSLGRANLPAGNR